MKVKKTSDVENLKKIMKKDMVDEKDVPKKTIKKTMERFVNS